MIKLQSDMLRLVALGKDLAFIANEICCRAEFASKGVACSITGVDAQGRLRPLAAPSFPESYAEALDGIAIGPMVGSCGSAAYLREEVVVTDIATDPRWEMARDYILALGFKACWSSPIFAEDGRVVASFAFYYDTCRGPSEEDRAVVDTCVDLCSIAIRHEETLNRITRLAYTDALTGLLNRTAFERFVSDALDQPRKAPVAVHYIDLDDFKTINDTMGHRAGDLLLVELSKRLQQSVGDGEAVARLGGDEFAICSPDGGLERQEEIARAVLAAFSRPVAVAGRLIRVGTSIGIAQTDPLATSLHQIMRNADLALYQAKGAGKNTYRLFSENIGAEMRRRNELRADLLMAVTRDELQLVYQPILDVVDGRIHSFEALLRWTHGKLGPVSPAVFVPLAEENGFITEIGDWALNRALRDAAAWPAGVNVAVNVSPTQLRRRAFPLEVVGALAKNGMPASRLDVEITETVLFDDSDTPLEALENLRSIGVGIALDDFGTGYSSLSLLRNRRFNRLKIDKTFVDGLGKDPDCEAIVNGLIDIARSLGIHITAEGVETRHQLDWLEARGCESVQGYLIGKPMAATEIAAFLMAFGRDGTERAAMTGA